MFLNRKCTVTETEKSSFKKGLKAVVTVFTVSKTSNQKNQWEKMGVVPEA